MNPVLRNVLTFIGALFIGNIVNMATVIFGHALIPAPDGVDIMNPESIANNMHLFEAKHFIFPFIAHALGTFVAAYMVVRLAASSQRILAWVIGGLFLVFGIINIFTISHPVWFMLVDLLLAYLPMAWLSIKIGIRD